MAFYCKVHDVRGRYVAENSQSTTDVGNEGTSNMDSRTSPAGEDSGQNGKADEGISNRTAQNMSTFVHLA